MSINEGLDMQLMAMRFEFGFLLGASAWALALNLTFGLVNNLLKELAEKVIPEENEAITRIFNSKTYRVIGFLLDKLARIKVPEQAKKRIGNTDIINKPPEPNKP